MTIHSAIFSYGFIRVLTDFLFTNVISFLYYKNAIQSDSRNNRAISCGFLISNVNHTKNFFKKVLTYYEHYVILVIVIKVWLQTAADIFKKSKINLTKHIDKL